jgi:hypothetical protein
LISAVKFTPKRGLVQVHLQRASSHVEIVVSDTGQGISEEQLPYLFERFHQADSTSTRSHTGLGLGLALVRHLVELYGGKVTAQSPGEGQGATFTVELPVAIVHREQEREARVHPTARTVLLSAAGPSLRGLPVLVVDDDRDSLDLVHAILVSSGAVDFTKGGKTPALALTAYGRVEDRLRTLSAGYSMHVAKPVDPAELGVIVASLAGRSSGP